MQRKPWATNIASRFEDHAARRIVSDAEREAVHAFGQRLRIDPYDVDARRDVTGAPAGTEQLAAPKGVADSSPEVLGRGMGGTAAVADTAAPVVEIIAVASTEGTSGTYEANDKFDIIVTEPNLLNGGNGNPFIAEGGIWVIPCPTCDDNAVSISSAGISAPVTGARVGRPGSFFGTFETSSISIGNKTPTKSAVATIETGGTNTPQDDIKVTALSTGIAAGSAGNAWRIFGYELPSASRSKPVDIAVEVDPAHKVITYTVRNGRTRVIFGQGNEIAHNFHNTDTNQCGPYGGTFPNCDPPPTDS